MADLGAIRHDAGITYLFVSNWYGFPPVRHECWANVEQVRLNGIPLSREIIEAIKAQPNGTVIRLESLPHIEIIDRPPQTKINDATLEALLREAEVMGR